MVYVAGMIFMMVTIMRAWMIRSTGRRIAIIAMVTVIAPRQRNDQKSEYGSKTEHLHG